MIICKYISDKAGSLQGGEPFDLQDFHIIEGEEEEEEENLILL